MSRAVRPGTPAPMRMRWSAKLVSPLADRSEPRRAALIAACSFRARRNAVGTQDALRTSPSSVSYIHKFLRLHRGLTGGRLSRPHHPKGPAGRDDDAVSTLLPMGSHWLDGGSGAPARRGRQSRMGDGYIRSVDDVLQAPRRRSDRRGGRSRRCAAITRKAHAPRGGARAERGTARVVFPAGRLSPVR